MANKKLIVTADALNVRSIPSTQGDKLGVLHRDEVVEWLETQADGKWHKVQKGTLIGWSSASYLEFTQKPAELDFSEKFEHLKDVKADRALSESDSKKLWDALAVQANDKEAFNKCVSRGVQPNYGAAQCATTTASVLECACIKAGLIETSKIFSDANRKADKFALTHEIEIMLKRLGFRMYDKKLYVTPRGAICFMAGRYNFAGCKQHSGHVYTMNTDKGADCKDIINDNGGFQHQYAHFTESFMLPAGIAAIARSATAPMPNPIGLTVKEIQHELNDHFDAQLVEDGLLGTKTEAAIKKAEEFLKLTVDGKADVFLSKALIELKGLVYDITPTPDVSDGEGGIKSTKFEDLKDEYHHLWTTCEIKAGKANAVNAVCASIISNKARYESVSKVTGVPWQVIAVIHHMEGGGNFNTHLHNGDPLNQRTEHVPAGRPKTGNPPFTWEVSAIDALGGDDRFKGKTWGIEETLFFLECYNGTGYRVGGGQATIPPRRSPYLWSFTNHYQSGKYIADHKFSPTAVSGQIGCAAMLRTLKYKEGGLYV
jgi:lysozyme family protein